MTKASGQRLLPFGSEVSSVGGSFTYRVVAPCCRLFDREELPWPCCKLAWRSKEPSWRRIGRRLVADMAARSCASYAVELLQPGAKPSHMVVSFYPYKLSPAMREWWYSKNPRSQDPSNTQPAAT